MRNRNLEPQPLRNGYATAAPPQDPRNRNLEPQISARRTGTAEPRTEMIVFDATVCPRRYAPRRRAQRALGGLGGRLRRLFCFWGSVEKLPFFADFAAELPRAKMLMLNYGYYPPDGLSDTMYLAWGGDTFEVLVSLRANAV